MKALNRTQLKQAAYARNEHHVMTAAGSAIEELLEPAVWVHVANLMKKFDVIEAVCEDGSYFVELLVVSAKGADVKLALLRHVVLSETLATVASDNAYEVKFRGRKRWSIIRTADKVIVKEDIETQQEAAAELEKLVA